MADVMAAVLIAPAVDASPGHSGGSKGQMDFRGRGWSVKAALDSRPADSPKGNLKSQMADWLKDSEWVDEPPAMKVSMGSGSLCELECEAKVALPPDAVFNTVRDPHNRRVFKNIKAVKNHHVVSDDGDVKVVEMELTFVWRLPIISGTFDAHVRMTQEIANRKLSFELTRPGFMKKFQGYWQVEPLFVPCSSAARNKFASSPSADSDASETEGDGEPGANEHRWNSVSSSSNSSGSSSPDRDLKPAPALAEGIEAVRVASRVILHQVVQPSISPPPLFKRCLRGILLQTTKDMFHDFQSEAARLRCGGAATAGYECDGEERQEGEGPFEEADAIAARVGKLSASFLYRETLGPSASAKLKKGGAMLKAAFGKKQFGKGKV